MRERDSGNQSVFGRLERGGSNRGPRQGLGVALQQVGEGLEDLGDLGDESSVEIDHPQKLLQMFDVRRRRKEADSVNMAREGDDASLTDHVAEKLEGWDRKSAFGRIDGQPILLQHLEKLPQVFQVLLHGGAGDKMIAQIGENEGKMREAAVHEALEGLGGVHEPKWHEQVFPETKGSDNRRFGDIAGSHGDLMVTLDKVDAERSRMEGLFLDTAHIHEK